MGLSVEIIIQWRLCFFFFFFFVSGTTQLLLFSVVRTWRFLTETNYNNYHIFCVVFPSFLMCFMYLMYPSCFEHSFLLKKVRFNSFIFLKRVVALSLLLPASNSATETDYCLRLGNQSLRLRMFLLYFNNTSQRSFCFFAFSYGKQRTGKTPKKKKQEKWANEQRLTLQEYDFRTTKASVRKKWGASKGGPY